MNIETTNNQRTLTPEDGMWLCDKKNKVISDKVYLGINADESEWSEISESEKLQLEAQWNGEPLPDSPDPTEATTSDLYNALEELGVKR